jgi:hypothetical protein
MENNMKKLKYDIKKYNFKKIVEDHFSVSDLSLLHKEREDLLPDQKLNFSNESKTKYHESFYSRLSQGWEEIRSAYDEFISNEISCLFDENIVFSNISYSKISFTQ